MKREGRRAEGERKEGIQDKGPGKGERRQRERLRARVRRAVVVKGRDEGLDEEQQPLAKLGRGFSR